MTNATHIGNSNIGSVRGLFVRVVGRDTDRRGYETVRYVNVHDDAAVMVAPGSVFDQLFRAV